MDDTEPRDVLDFLFNVSHESSPVIFYDSNETVTQGQRIAHTVWVMQSSQSTLNTSNE